MYAKSRQIYYTPSGELLYSDGSTLPVTYGYDKASVLIGTTQITPANGIGRLSWSCVALPTSCQSMTSYSYDPMGRVAEQWFMTPGNQAAAYSASAIYDLAGNVTSLTYPDGRVVTNTWDGAGHQQTSTFASWNGTNVSYPYLTSGMYWPNGAFAGLAYGNGMANGHHMNNRQQIDEVGFVYLPSKTSYSLKVYCFGVATQPLASGFPSCDQLASGNNGHILQIKDVQTPANNQAFIYDTLNRIRSASGPGFSQQYGLDAFGNMSITAGGSFAATFDPATNRMSVSV